MRLTAEAHIGVMIVSASLILAQRERWYGKTLLKAIVAGYGMAAAWALQCDHLDHAIRISVLAAL